MLQYSFFSQDMARVSIMADVQQVKDAVMQEGLSSHQVSDDGKSIDIPVCS